MTTARGCDIDKIDVRVRVVTVTSWKSFADAFADASLQIKSDDYLWDVQVSHSADCGYELKLYFLKGVK